MSERKVRWGILGTAKIAPKNWWAIGYSGNSTVTAVASRDLERSRRFIAECEATLPMPEPPEAFGSYEAMLASKNVDAVYIPLPTGLRKEWVIRAAEAGKHVLCEKPCALSVADLEEMTGACRRHGVQFMDGVMFMHNQRLPALREKIQDPAQTGELRRITSSHCFSASEEFLTRNIRTSATLEPFGSLGDLAWYSIRLSLWVMDWQMPRLATGRNLRQFTQPGGAPVATDFSGELVFDGGVSAGFFGSFRTGREQWAIISGSKGKVEIPDFVADLSDNPAGGPTTQEANMCRNFSNLVLSGTTDEFWPEIALKTQRVMVDCYQSALRNS
jgi:predicted dehydrogenase